MPSLLEMLWAPISFFSNQHPSISRKEFENIKNNSNTAHPAGSSVTTSPATKNFNSKNYTTGPLGEDSIISKEKKYQEIVDLCEITAKENSSGGTDNPLHIGAHFGEVDFLRWCLALKQGEEWCHQTNQSGRYPLDMALKNVEPNIKCIKLLYDHTKNPNVLKAYLPESLVKELKEDTIEAVKACIQENPYQLNDELLYVHEKYQSQCKKYNEYQERYEKAIVKPKNFDEVATINKMTLISHCEEDPFAILVCMSSVMGERVPVIAEFVQKMTTFLVRCVVNHSAQIGINNAVQLLQLVLERSFSLQKDKKAKITFLNKMNGCDLSESPELQAVISNVQESLNRELSVTEGTQRSVSTSR